MVLLQLQQTELNWALTNQPPQGGILIYNVKVNRTSRALIMFGKQLHWLAHV